MRSGPQTEEGKKNVRSNAVTHGILSKSPVLRSIESEEEWTTHFNGLRESLRPAGYLEEYLVERIAYSSWQLRRIQAFETAQLTTSQELIEETAAGQAISRVVKLDKEMSGKTVDSELVAAKQRRRLVRRLYKTDDVVELRNQDLRHLDEAINSAYEHARIDAQMEIESIRNTIQDQRHNRFLQSNGIHSIAIERIPWALVQYCEDEVRRLEEVKRNLSATIDPIRKDQLVLDEQTSAKIIRYQSHHQRQFLQILHELEAIQARRHGAATPLARVDVQLLGANNEDMLSA